MAGATALVSSDRASRAVARAPRERHAGLPNGVHSAASQQQLGVLSSWSGSGVSSARGTGHDEATVGGGFRKWGETAAEAAGAVSAEGCGGAASAVASAEEAKDDEKKGDDDAE